MLIVATAIVNETWRMQSLDANAASLSVLIASPAAKANAGLSGWLSTLEGIIVMGAETAVIKALTLADALKPDVVLLDFESDGYAFLHIISLFVMISPPPAVIVLAQQPTPLIRRRCAELGAESVFEKTNDLDGISEALQGLRRRKIRNSAGVKN